MHIDVNNAFLSWSAIELLNKGSKVDIRDTYAVIGGNEITRSGIVLAKSNLCKKLGIVTAETLYSARKKCPALRVYPPNFSFYNEMSKSLFNLLSKYTPDIEIASIDECYLDYGKVKKLYGNEYEFAKKVQKEIFSALGFTVNIGIANNKLCAKMASDFSKPYKIHTLYDYEVREKMYPLPINDLFGIGKKTTEKLKELKINTISDLANFDPTILKKYFKNMAIDMINSAKGINSDEVISDYIEQKGIGNEITLIKDTLDEEILFSNLLEISEMLGIRLRKEKKYAYTICVVIKTKEFKRKSHQITLLNATNITSEIYENAKIAYRDLYNEDLVRLIGIRLNNLVDNRTLQTSLFENNEKVEYESKLDTTIDKLKEKYGYKIIKKASLMSKKEKETLKKQ